MKKNSIMLVVYMLIMVGGPWVCKTLLHTPYAASNFSEKFLPFMAILAACVIGYGIRYKEELTISYKTKKSYLISAFLAIPVIGFGFYSIITGFSMEMSFWILIIDTALIGIAEEGMYRGILLGGLSRKLPPIGAIFVSSLLFSALHLLNIIGGVEISDVANQLLSTFVIGFFLGLMYLETRNLLLPILFHALWDYIILSGALGQLEIMPLVLIGIYIAQIVLSILMIIKIVKSSKG